MSSILRYFPPLHRDQEEEEDDETDAEFLRGCGYTHQRNVWQDLKNWALCCDDQSYNMLLNWATGTGKSYLMIRFIRWAVLHTDRQIWFCTKYQQLRDTVRKQLCTMLGDRGSQVHILDSELKHDSRECRVVVACHKGLQTWRAVSGNHLPSGALFFGDECHWNEVEWMEVASSTRCCFASATYNEAILPLIAPEHHHRFDYSTGRKLGMLKSLQLYQTFYSHLDDIERCILKSIEELQTQRIIIFAAFQNESKKKSSSSVKGLVNALHQLVEKHYFDPYKPCIRGASGQTPDGELVQWMNDPPSSDNDVRILVACQKLTEGADMVPVDHLIFTCNKNSKREIFQKLGRGMRAFKERVCHVELLHITGGSEIKEAVLTGVMRTMWHLDPSIIQRMGIRADEGSEIPSRQLKKLASVSIEATVPEFPPGVPRAHQISTEMRVATWKGILLKTTSPDYAHRDADKNRAYAYLRQLASPSNMRWDNEREFWVKVQEYFGDGRKARQDKFCDKYKCWSGKEINGPLTMWCSDPRRHDAHKPGMRLGHDICQALVGLGNFTEHESDLYAQFNNHRTTAMKYQKERAAKKASPQRELEEQHYLEDHVTIRRTKAFRIDALNLYGHRCSLTGRTDLRLLQGCHIIDLKFEAAFLKKKAQVEAEGGTAPVEGLNDVANCVILDSSCHQLFDASDDTLSIKPVIEPAIEQDKIRVVVNYSGTDEYFARGILNECYWTRQQVDCLRWRQEFRSHRLSERKEQQEACAGVSVTIAAEGGRKRRRTADAI